VYNIAQMEEKDIIEAIDLWHKNYSIYFKEDVLPDVFMNGKGNLENYLMDRIKSGNAIIIKKNGFVAGYFSWFYDDFHNEKSTFCPMIGHCGMENDKENIYIQLYNYVSKEWIKNNAFNHLWMINYNDNLLKNFSYDIGFGSYVIDLYINNGSIINTSGQYKVTQAYEKDSELLYNLVEESRHYYLDAPIFLKREVIPKENIKEIIKNNVVFLAWDNNYPIGFMNIGINSEDDIIQLIVSGDAVIDKLGAYVKMEYRNKGIGKTLLSKVFQYCNDNGIKNIHVDFETANTHARKFWPKYFKPKILSVRRTVNKDANI